jgi:outer membrane lipoprotein-sorting protein
MFRRTLWALAAIALLAPIASAADAPAPLPTVDQIVAKYVDARGGMDKIKAVKTMRQTGKMTLPQGMELPFTITAKRPKSSRMEFTFQGMTGMQVCDGTMAWAVMPFMGKKDPEPMGADETKTMLDQSDFDGPIIDYKEKGNQIEVMDKEQVEGADAYKLKVTTKSGDVRYVYVDAESYLEVKVDQKRTMRGTEVESESILGDYREEGGMMMPHSIENRPKGAPAGQKMTIDKVELNVDIADSQFAMPKVASADSTKAGAAAAPAAASAASDSAKGASGAAAKTADATKTSSKKKK